MIVSKQSNRTRRTNFNLHWFEIAFVLLNLRTRVPLNFSIGELKLTGPASQQLMSLLLVVGWRRRVATFFTEPKTEQSESELQSELFEINRERERTIFLFTATNTTALTEEPPLFFSVFLNVEKMKKKKKRQREKAEAHNNRGEKERERESESNVMDKEGCFSNSSSNKMEVCPRPTRRHSHKNGESSSQ